MKLKIWVEVILIVLASICGIHIFAESLIISFFGLIGVMLFCIPLAKYGRLIDKENERK